MLDFQLHDLAVQLVDLGGHRVEFHAQPRRRFVHQVHGLVGEEAVGDITVRKGGGGHEGGILDANAVMHFVALLQAAQDGDRGFDRRLFDINGLETALEGGVLLNMFAVFVEGGRADAAQFAASQLGLEHVGGVRRPFRLTRADQGVKFIDEEDNAPFAGGDFLQEGL